MTIFKKRGQAIDAEFLHGRQIASARGINVGEEKLRSELLGYGQRARQDQAIVGSAMSGSTWLQLAATASTLGSDGWTKMDALTPRISSDEPT